MPMKGGGRADLQVIDHDDGGLGWLAYPDETMQRASHALTTPEGIWIIDPVDADGVDDRLAELGAESDGPGEVAGVAVCLDRHKRDAATIASRHGVDVFVPTWMSGVAEEIDAPVSRFSGALGDSGFQSFVIRDSSLPPWQEAGLFNPETGTMVIPESVGAASYFLAGDERLGVHPMLRLTPPDGLRSQGRPERVRLGHGAGISGDAAAALETALTSSRANTPSLYAQTLKGFLTG
jgi:hypothetical protein